MTDDLKERLDRLGDRVPERSDAFERLIRVRERKQRNRRRGGLVLGLAVALVGSLVAVAALRDGSTTLPRGSETPNVPTAWQPPDVLTIWPETPMDEGVAADVQELVDAGAPDVQWRLDPEQVAERFGLEFLVWSSADAHDVELSDGTATATLTPCPHAETCRPIGELRVFFVQSAEPGPGGIWSISAVVSDDLAIDVAPADPTVALAGGSRIGFDISLDPERATSAHIGFTAENGCSGVGTLTPALESGDHELTLPELEPATEDCGPLGAGYVFAYVTDDTTIPVGDPLVEPTAIEFPWLTVVPFYLEMEQPDATGTATVSPSPVAPTPTPAPTATDALRVCGADDSPDGSVVVAGAAGVGVHVGTYNVPVKLVVDGKERIRAIVDYGPVVTLGLEPSEHSLRCIVEATNVLHDPVRFEVVDPNGYWIDPTLDCDGYAHTDFNSGAIRVDQMDEFASSILMGNLGNLSEQVTIVPGGYPENQDERVYLAVTADGRVAGSVTFSHREGTEWLPDGFSTCSIDAMF